MELITNNDFQKIMRKNEILTPNQIFSGLRLHDEDYITLGEFCDISRQETIKKYQALRELINICCSTNKSYINGLWYTEKKHPVLSILLQNTSKDYFNIDETLYKYSDGNYSTELSNRGYSKMYYYFPITEETLDMILKGEMHASKIDNYLRENAMDILKLYKEYLDEGIFYSDLYLTDITGKAEIRTHHEDIISDEMINSITLPENFGKVTASYRPGYLINSMIINYQPEKDEFSFAGTLSTDDYDKRLFIDKHFLPEVYRKKGVK